MENKFFLKKISAFYRLRLHVGDEPGQATREDATQRRGLQEDRKGHESASSDVENPLE
jgi:hypothetical protein